MTNLKIRNILISDLELFLIKGASCEEKETCFLYKWVSYTREHTVVQLCDLSQVFWPISFVAYSWSVRGVNEMDRYLSLVLRFLGGAATALSKLDSS